MKKQKRKAYAIISQLPCSCRLALTNLNGGTINGAFDRGAEKLSILLDWVKKYEKANSRKLEIVNLSKFNNPIFG